MFLAKNMMDKIQTYLKTLMMRMNSINFLSSFCKIIFWEN